MAIKILLASQQDQEKLQCYKLWKTQIRSYNAINYGIQKIKIRKKKGQKIILHKVKCPLVAEMRNDFENIS